MDQEANEPQSVADVQELKAQADREVSDKAAQDRLDAYDIDSLLEDAQDTAPQKQEKPEESLPPEGAVATPAASSPKHSSELVELAHQFRISDSDIEALSPEALQVLIRHKHQDFMAFAASQRQPTAPPAEPEKDDLDDKIAKLKADGLDEQAEIIGHIKALKQQNKSLEARLEKDRLARQADDDVRVERNIDAAFESLGKDYEDIFGKGSIRSLKSGSDESERRMAVVKRAADIAKSEGISLDDAIKRTSKKLYKPTAKADPVMEKRTNQYKNAFSARPNGRKSVAAGKGDGEAYAAAGDWFRERGLPTASKDDDNILEGFPD